MLKRGKKMKKNIGYFKQIQKASFWTIYLIVGLSIFGVCYADVTTEPVVIQCCKTTGAVPIHKFPGIPNTKLSLTTEGLSILGVRELFTDLSVIKHQLTPQTEGIRESDVVVIAECLTYRNGIEIEDSINTYKNMWPPGSVLACNKGDGLEVTMVSPNDENPEKYRYVATLTREKDDEVSYVPSIKIVSLDIFTQRLQKLNGYIAYSEILVP